MVETEFEGLEEARQDALEVAEEAHEAAEAPAEDETALINLQVLTPSADPGGGPWGHRLAGNYRAPVKGVTAYGFADPVMNNWSGDP